MNSMDQCISDTSKRHQAAGALFYTRKLANTAVAFLSVE